VRKKTRRLRWSRGLKCVTPPPTSNGTTDTLRLERAREHGREREQAAQIVKNTRHVDSLTGTAKFRVPNEITEAGIREVMNVKELSLTNQIKDLLLVAQKEKKQLTIVIRKGTKLSKPLQELVDKGQILIEFLP
jgi:hypothetical protein